MEVILGGFGIDVRVGKMSKAITHTYNCRTCSEPPSEYWKEHLSQSGCTVPESKCFLRGGGGSRLLEREIGRERGGKILLLTQRERERERERKKERGRGREGREKR